VNEQNLQDQNPTQPPPPQQQPPAPAYQPAPPRRLVRRSDDKMVAGVCSGLAGYFGIDVTLVRVLTVLGAIFGLGSIILVYLVLWVVMPEA
jgi:phage shock protein C